jgi:hypothetical protein
VIRWTKVVTVQFSPGRESQPVDLNSRTLPVEEWPFVVESEFRHLDTFDTCACNLAIAYPGYCQEVSVQKWECLEVIRDGLGEMTDNTGRRWDSNVVRATIGEVKTRAGTATIQLAWWAATGLGDLGAEGWELVRVVPNTGFGGSVSVSRPNSSISGAALLIFKRPKE